MQNRPPSNVTVLVILVVAASLVVAGAALASGPEGGNARTTLTVTPSDGLAAAQTVAVSGAGFVPSKDIQVIQCSAPLGAGARGPQDVVCTIAVIATADASGSFGPFSFEVTRTFSGITGGRDPQPATHTCAASDDCVVYAISISTKMRYALHHVNFAA